MASAQERGGDFAEPTPPVGADIGRMNALLDRTLDADFFVREQARVDLLRLEPSDLPALAVALGQQPAPARQRLGVLIEEAVIHIFQREEKLTIIRELVDPQTNRTPAEQVMAEQVLSRGFVGVGGSFPGGQDELRQAFRFRDIDGSAEVRRGFAVGRVIPAFAASEVLEPGDVLLGIQLEDGPVRPAWTLNAVITLLTDRVPQERVRLIVLRGTRLLARELNLDLPITEGRNGATASAWDLGRQRAIRDATQTWNELFVEQLEQARPDATGDIQDAGDGETEF